LPARNYFKPCGVPSSQLEEIVLAVDELEALRLADLEGLYQNRAAGAMSVSRQTFGRIVEEARRKVADALVKGKALRIEGGDVELDDQDMALACGCCRQTEETKATACPPVTAKPRRTEAIRPARAQGVARRRRAPRSPLV
jgi:predicted DNA-binding protein (UPF0251 family)